MADGFPQSHDRFWRSSRHLAYGSHLVFAVHVDTDNFNTTMVQLFHNEHIVQLPFCQSTTCTEEEIRDAWEEEARTCDFEEICGFEQEDQGDQLWFDEPGYDYEFDFHVQDV
jgi:hypothetical protein